MIDNAVKYSPENPKIVIATSPYKDGIEISVRDNGVGISDEAQKHIFEKFYREPTGNVHNIKGFGLGLNYVKTIVEFYNGTIRLVSKKGEGSTFIIKLPLKN